MTVSGLVPARFLSLSVQLIFTIILFLSMNCNVLSCLPNARGAVYDGTFGSTCQPPDTQSQHYGIFTSEKTGITIALSISIGILAFETVGLVGGISTFMPSQGLISTGCHAAGAICIILYRFDSWCSSYFWFIFGFCSAVPFVSECFIWIGIFVLKKSI